jgi:hypothetical protein
MTTVNNPVRHAIGKALTNDANGTLSTADAKNIVKAAVTAIAKAKDPEQAFEAAKADLKAAERFLGQNAAKTELNKFDSVGRSAVATRLEHLTGQTQLPLDVKRDFTAMVKDQGLTSGTATISNVKGNERTGFEFNWRADGETKKAFAFSYNGNWVFSPEKLTKANLDTATKAFQKYFDENWAQDLRDNGSSAAEVREMRTNFFPTRVMFPGESDPQDLVSSYPMVFSLNNPTGSDHGCYVGLNPRTNETEAYTFN